MRCFDRTLGGGGPATQLASKKTASGLYHRCSMRPWEFLKSFSTSRIHCQGWVVGAGFDALCFAVTP